MKSNWQIKKLGEVCDIGAGNTAPQKKEAFIDGKYPFFRTSDVGRAKISKSLNQVSDYLNDKGIKNLKLFKKGTILLPKSGASTFLNHRVIMGADGYVASHLAAIKVDEKILNNNFLFYFLQEIKAQDLIQDHRYPSLNLLIIKEIEVSLPPLSEQCRIVKILDEVFEGIGKAKENAENNLKNSRELFESYLQNVFTNPGKNWKEKTLKDVCHIQSKLINPRKPEFLDLIHVGAGNIEIKTGELINLKTSREEKLISGKFEFDNSMVLYSKIRPYLMKIVRPNFKGLCSADIYPLLPHKNLMIRDYLFYLLLTSVFTEFAIKGSARAGMPKVNREHLFTFSFFLPSLSEQKFIVKKLDALAEKTKKLEEIYKQKISDLEELKKSVLKKAFSGELVKQEVDFSYTIPSPFIRNQVNAAVIAQAVKDGGSSTEVAVAKYNHLLQEVLGLNLGYQFQVQKFGPFDAEIKRLIWSGLGKNKWFTKRRGMIVYGSNIDALLSKKSNLYYNAQSAMKELAKLGVTKLDTDKVELLSTICHSIKETRSTALDKIRDFMSHWPTDRNRTKADKFPSEQTQKCLSFIIKNNLHLNLTK